MLLSTVPPKFLHKDSANIPGKHKIVFFFFFLDLRVKTRGHEEPQPLLGCLEGLGQQESLGAWQAGATIKSVMIMLLWLAGEQTTVS